MNLKKLMLIIKRFEIRKTITKAFGKHLLLVNTLSCGLSMFGADIVQQKIEYLNGSRNNKRYDWNRVGEMFLVGASFGPLYHYFYGYLDFILPKRNLHTVIIKIGMDQFIMSPISITQFLCLSTFLEMKSTKDCIQELREKFIAVYKLDWCIWPPTQFINFKFIPLKLQVLYINGVTMVYNIFLSYIKHK